MSKKCSISIIGYGSKESVEGFSNEINGHLVDLARDHQIKFYDILKKKYNESNPDCFKNPDKLTFKFTPFAEKIYWGFSNNVTKDAVFNASFASMDMNAVDYSEPYYNRGELIHALKNPDLPKVNRENPALLKMEISYETIPLLNNIFFLRCTVWFFDKTIEELKSFWMKTVESLDKSHGDAFHSSYLSDNPYPFSILHCDSFEKYNFEEIADHILGIEKYTYLSKSLLMNLSQRITWDSSCVLSSENGMIFSFSDTNYDTNFKEKIVKEHGSILISGYYSFPLYVLLTRKMHFSFPLTVCVINSQPAVPKYIVYLFYGGFSKESISEIIPNVYFSNIIDVFKLT